MTQTQTQTTEATAADLNAKKLVLDQSIFLAGLQAIKAGEVGNVYASWDDLQFALDPEILPLVEEFFCLVSGTRDSTEWSFNTDEMIGLTIEPSGGIKAVYAPRLYRDPEDEAQIILSFGSNSIKVEINKTEFKIGDVVGEVSGVTVKRTKPEGQVDFELAVLELFGDSCIFQVGISLDNQDINATTLKALVRKGSPIAPLLKVVGSGGGLKMLSMFFVPNFPQNTEVPIQRDYKVTALVYQKPNEYGPSVIFEIDPEYLPTTMYNSKGETTSATSFYGSGKTKVAAFATPHAVGLWNKLIQTGKPVTLKIKTAKWEKTESQNRWFIDWELTVREPKKLQAVQNKQPALQSSDAAQATVPVAAVPVASTPVAAVPTPVEAIPVASTPEATPRIA